MALDGEAGGQEEGQDAVNGAGDAGGRREDEVFGHRLDAGAVEG